MQFIGCIVLGLLAGVASGLFGIGGGLILIPSLIFIFGFSQLTANGTSLVALLLPVGLLGVIEYHRSGKLSGDHIKLGLMIAIGMFVGTYVGARIATSLPQEILRKAFGVFLVLVAARLWFLK